MEPPTAVPDDAAAGKTPPKQKGKGPKAAPEQVPEAASPAVSFSRSVVAELAKHAAAQPDSQAALLQLLRLCLSQLLEGRSEGRRAALLLVAVSNAALRAEGGASCAFLCLG